MNNLHIKKLLIVLCLIISVIAGYFFFLKRHQPSEQAQTLAHAGSIPCMENITVVCIATQWVESLEKISDHGHELTTIAQIPDHALREKALQKFDKLASDKEIEKSPYTTINRAHILFALGREDEALELVDTPLDSLPSAARERAKFDLLVRSGKYEEALKLSETMRRVPDAFDREDVPAYPYNPRASSFYQLFRHLLEDGETQKAKQAAGLALTIDSEGKGKIAYAVMTEELEIHLKSPLGKAPEANHEREQALKNAINESLTGEAKFHAFMNASDYYHSIRDVSWSDFFLREAQGMISPLYVESRSAAGVQEPGCVIQRLEERFFEKGEIKHALDLMQKHPCSRQPYKALADYVIYLSQTGNTKQFAKVYPYIIKFNVGIEERMTFIWALSSFGYYKDVLKMIDDSKFYSYPKSEFPQHLENYYQSLLIYLLKDSLDLPEIAGFKRAAWSGYMKNCAQRKGEDLPKNMGVENYCYGQLIENYTAL